MINQFIKEWPMYDHDQAFGLEMQFVYSDTLRRKNEAYVASKMSEIRRIEDKAKK